MEELKSKQTAYNSNDDFGFLTMTESVKRTVTTFSFETAQNEANDMMNELAHGEACALCYIEPWGAFKSLPFLRCMDQDGDILRITIEVKQIPDPENDQAGIFELHFTRWQIDMERLDAMRPKKV